MQLVEQHSTDKQNITDMGMMPHTQCFKTNICCIKYPLELSYKQAKLFIRKSLICGHGCEVDSSKSVYQ